MPRRGAWATEGNDDYFTPHPLQAIPPRVAVSLGGLPRVAVSLEATLH